MPPTSTSPGGWQPDVVQTAHVDGQTPRDAPSPGLAFRAFYNNKSGYRQKVNLTFSLGSGYNHKDAAVGSEISPSGYKEFYETSDLAVVCFTSFHAQTIFRRMRWGTQDGEDSVWCCAKHQYTYKRKTSPKLRFVPRGATVFLTGGRVVGWSKELPVVQRDTTFC